MRSSGLEGRWDNILTTITIPQNIGRRGESGIVNCDLPSSLYPNQRKDEERGRLGNFPSTTIDHKVERHDDDMKNK